MQTAVRRSRAPATAARTLAGVALLAAAASSAARGQASLPDGFSEHPVVLGLDRPVQMAFLPDGRLLVLEKNTGHLRMVRNGVLLAAPVATVDSLRIAPEQGALGLAVDPGWPARPYVYVHHDHSGGPWIRVVRLTLAGDLDFSAGGDLAAVPGSLRPVLAQLPDSTEFHNGGGLEFGPDGMLYVALGDDLQHCTAAYVNVLRGKLLRVDVSGVPDGGGPPPALEDLAPADNPFAAHPDPRARLVWAYGLRNPYSFHVDPPTGRVFIADVGMAEFEEISVAGTGGLNFGWPTWEGFYRHMFSCAGQDTLAPVPPVYTYDRSQVSAGAAIVSGVVYRPVPGGAASYPASYDGDYFFGDLYEGFLRRLRLEGGTWSLAPPAPGQPSAEDWARGLQGVTDWDLGPDGAMWACFYPFGEIRRIAFQPVNDVAGRRDARVALEHPFPSPATSATRVDWRLAEAGAASVEVFDAAGRRVRALWRGPAPAGPGSARWDLRDGAGARVAPGVYRVRLVAGGHVATRAIVVTR